MRKPNSAKTRHGLHDVGETENRFAQARLARQQDAQRHADQHGDAGGDDDEK